MCGLGRAYLGHDAAANHRGTRALRGIGVAPVADARALAGPARHLMPAQPRHRSVADLDDPWGFGRADGTLVEVRHDSPPEPVDAGHSPTAAFERAAVPGASSAPPWPPAQPLRSADHAGEAQPYPHVTVDADPRYFQPPRSRRPSPMLTGAVVALLVAGGFAWIRAEGARDARDSNGMGTFVLSSQPPGATVTLDGRAVGVTPLALPLAEGAHELVATASNGVSERLSATVPPGESASRHLLLMPPATAAAPAPVAAPSPVVAPTPAPAAAASTTTAAPTPPPAVAVAPARGSVTFSLPFDVQVYEGGTFLGSNSGERINVRPGTHTFTLVNEPLGFRGDETVVVGAGQSVRRVVEQRSATLSVNALPWAEVLISGRSYGETPLANITLPIGVYRVTLRHPTLGDREVPVTVRLGVPNRAAVDLRR